MYWLRWHYHVKYIAGHCTKLNKRWKRRQSVVTGRQQLDCALDKYWHISHSTVTLLCKQLTLAKKLIYFVQHHPFSTCTTVVMTNSSRDSTTVTWYKRSIMSAVTKVFTLMPLTTKGKGLDTCYSTTYIS